MTMYDADPSRAHYYSSIFWGNTKLRYHKETQIFTEISRAFACISISHFTFSDCRLKFNRVIVM